MNEKNREQRQTAEQVPFVYRDFNLRFGSFDETKSTFRVWVEGETPGGTMRPDDAPTCIYDPAAFWSDPAAGRGGLLGKLEGRRVNREDLFTLGKQLADLALPEGKLRNLFRMSMAALKPHEGLRLRLRLDPIALTQLPWEFLALPESAGEPQATDFLALRRECSIARTDTIEASVRGIPQREEARIVGVLSHPGDQPELSLEKDQAALEQAVQALAEATGESMIKVIWVKDMASREALTQALAGDTDIFHFAGHGIFDPASSRGQILLERADERGDPISDPFSGEQLAQLLRSAGVRLVLLGACETGRRDGQNVWSGVAPALTRQKIPAVIANQFRIKDVHAYLLASMVYPSLLAGATVDEALYDARQAIYQHNGLEDRDWGVPVLYLHDSSGVLFPSDATDNPASSPFLEVIGEFQEVEGEVIGIQIGEMIGNQMPDWHARVKHKVENVKKTGKVKGIVIKKLGGFR